MHAPGTMIQRQRGLTLADGISLIRLPLALIFVVFDDVPIRVVVLCLAGVSDLGDGWVARRRGGSWIGELLDPVADKIFMLTAFLVVMQMGALTWFEVLAVLIRDLVASIAFFVTLLRGRGTAVPARIGGKIVTTLQLITVLCCLLGFALRVQLAWLTAGAALYAIFDYSRHFFRKLGTT